MNRTQLEILRNKLTAALDAERFDGFKATVGKCTYGDNHCSFKVEFAVVTKEGTVLTREAEDFLMFCDSYGFKKEDMGRVVVIKSEQYRIIGAKWGNKYDICTERVNGGAKYSWQSRGILNALGRPEDAKKLEVL